MITVASRKVQNTIAIAVWSIYIGTIPNEIWDEPVETCEGDLIESFPFDLNIFGASELPLAAAKCKAVFPFSFTIFTFAPLWISILANTS